jgi:predicted Rossmann fold flavoprotein
MSESPRVLVIGAGAAGLMCAITAARHGAAVTLLEGQPKPGAKILASGGSRCNLTHREVLPENFHGGSRRVTARLLRELDAAAAREFFEQLGVATKLEPTGKVFPVSDSAVTVRDALLRAAAEAGVELRCGARVVALERVEPGFEVRLDTGETLRAPRVALATGGLSYPSTGSRGDGLAWAEALGHTIVPTVPALVPLTTGDGAAHALSGLTLDAELVLRRGAGGRELYRVTGSFLFTHFGCSGPAPLNLSRHFLRARAEGPAWVEASWLPGRGYEDVDRALQAARERDPRRSVEHVLSELLPRRLAETVAGRAGLERGATAAGAGMGGLRRETRQALARLATEWPLDVTGTLGYEKAEATAGGVDLSEVHPSTMESRRAPGLFLCGEVLDVDGMLGGFNFQWAWSSGYVAGRGAAR